MEATGVFTVKAAYFTMENTPAIESGIHRIWRIRVPPRMRVFGWLLFHNRVLTADNLRIRGFHIVGMCYICRRSDETVRHLFSECPVSEQVYGGTLQGVLVLVLGQDNVQLLIEKNTADRIRELMLISHFIIWREKCNCKFRERSKNTTELKLIPSHLFFFLKTLFYYSVILCFPFFFCYFLLFFLFFKWFVKRVSTQKLKKTVTNYG